MSTEYKIEIWKTGDRYIGEIGELSLVLSDTDLARLSVRVEQEKEKILAEYATAGIPTPESAATLDDRTRRGAKPRDFGLFSAKVAVIAIAASIVMVVAVDRLADHVIAAFGGATGPFHLLSIVAERFETLPEVERQKALRNVDIIVHGMRPFVDKVRPLLDPDATAPNVGAEPNQK